MTHKVLTDIKFVKLIHSAYVGTRLRKESHTERKAVFKHLGEAVSQEIHRPPYGQCRVFGQGSGTVLIPRAILLSDLGIKRKRVWENWQNGPACALVPSYPFNSKHTLQPWDLLF